MKLLNIYNETCKSYLVGESRFHVDLPQKRFKEVYAIESLFLGKKSYFDLLEYVDDNNKEHNIQDDLARMNGFPTPCIVYYAKETKMSVLYV